MYIHEKKKKKTRIIVPLFYETAVQALCGKSDSCPIAGKIALVEEAYIT